MHYINLHFTYLLTYVTLKTVIGYTVALPPAVPICPL